MRGFLGRRRAYHLWILQQQQLQRLAATNIQRMYRGFRGRILAAVARALQLLRQRSNIAALMIQRIARGHLGRQRANEKKATVLRWKIEKRASTQIQRIFRGHKGKEAAVIEKELSKVEALARPLLSMLRFQEEAQAKLFKLIWRMDYADKALESELLEIDRELEECDTVREKNIFIFFLSLCFYLCYLFFNL